MKIAMLGHKAVPSRLGGIEIHVEDLAERLVKKGHEVHLYNRSVYDKGLEEYKGIKLHSAWTVKKNSLEALIYSIVASFKVAFGSYDIVHYHALGPTVMSFIPRLMGKKVVCTVHGLDWQRAKWKGFATSYLKFGEYASANFVHSTISVSKTLVPYYKKKYGREIHFIPNGINKRELKPLGKLEKDYNIKSGKYLLFVARIVPEKGCHYLIEAFKSVPGDFSLVIAGDNPYNKEYVDSLKAMVGDDKRIKMIGFQGIEVLDKLYSNAYAYILPSDIEGMPISLLEAMSYGNLCLVSDIPENTAVIEEMGVCFEKGKVESLTEKLEMIMQKDFKEKMGFNPEKIRSYIEENYDWDLVTEKTEDLYQKTSKKKLISNKEDQGMIPFFRNCIRLKWLFLLLTLMTMLLNYLLVIKDFNPAYESHTSLFVGQNPENRENLDTYEILQSVQIGEKLVFDVPEVVYGSEVLSAVNENLKAKGFTDYQYSSEDMKKAVKTEVVKNSRVVDITVKAKSPEEAQLVATIIADTTDKVVKEIMVKDYIHIIKNADLPKKITGMGRKTLWLLGMIGGLFLGFLTALIITMVQNFNRETGRKNSRELENNAGK